MSKTGGVILVVSLMLNAFLIGKSFHGYMGPPMRGGLHGPQEMDPPAGPPEAFFFAEIARKANDLSAEGQAKVRAVLDKYKQQDRAQFSSMKDLFDEAQEVLLADPFDPEKLASIHNQISDADVAGKKQIGDMMLEIATVLSKEDRLIFFKEMGPKHKPDGPPEPHGKDRW